MKEVITGIWLGDVSVIDLVKDKGIEVIINVGQTVYNIPIGVDYINVSLIEAYKRLKEVYPQADEESPVRRASQSPPVKTGGLFREKQE